MDPETNESELQTEATKSAETLTPKGAPGESKAGTLAAFTHLLSQLGKEDLTSIFNDVQSQFGANKAPGAKDNSSTNTSSVAAKPSAAVGKGMWKEDVDALFEEDFSEELREKVETIFEAAVNTRIELELAKLSEEYENLETELEEAYESKLEESVATITEQLVEKIDQYLDYCVEQWMEDNELAIDTGLRTDIAENFIHALHDVFAEHYISVPNEKTDLISEMNEQITQLKEMLDEAMESKLELEAIIESQTKESIIEDITEDLALTQAEKLKVLAEGIEFTDEETYRKKLDIIKEKYFGKSNTTKIDTGLIVEEIDGVENTDNETRFTAPGMETYVKALTRSVK